MNLIRPNYPLGSPHAWHYERLIRSVRRALNGLLDESELSEDTLMTVLCDAEKVINDRPIAPFTSVDPEHTPLTHIHSFASESM